MFVLHNKIGCLCVCILCYFIFFPSFCFIYSNPNWTARKHPHSNPCMLLFWNMPIARFYANIVTALFFHCSILILHLNWFCAHFHVQKFRWLLFLKIRGIFGFTATAWWYTTWFLFLLSRSMCDKVFTRLGSCLFWICIYIILFSFFFVLLAVLVDFYGNASNHLRPLSSSCDDIDVLHFACSHVCISDSCFSFVSSWYSCLL